MKKPYEKAEMKITVFDTDAVFAASGGGGETPSKDDIAGDNNQLPVL